MKANLIHVRVSADKRESFVYALVKNGYRETPTKDPAGSSAATLMFGVSIEHRLFFRKLFWTIAEIDMTSDEFIDLFL